MANIQWLQGTSPAFRLMIATSWLAPDSWQKNQEDAIREAIGAGPDWTEYLRLVDRHRTPALSWAALKRVPGLAIPESTRKGLQERSDACRIQAVRHSLMQAEIVKAFDRAGIPVMTLKGTILSLDLYGDVGLRQSNDLDLVVAPDDISRAQACLESLGWHLDNTYFPITPRQQERLREAEHHLGFFHSERGGVLELHWRNHWDMPGEAAAQWARRATSVWQGCSYRVLNPIDLVLYLSSHGGHHAWFRAKWLGIWRVSLPKGAWIGTRPWTMPGVPDRRSPYWHACSCCTSCMDSPCPAFMGIHGKTCRLFWSIALFAPSRLQKTVRTAAIWNCFPILSGSAFFDTGGWLCREEHGAKSLNELAYCRDDFRVLRLPDSLTWAYTPLHPILWAWVRIAKIWTR